MVINILGSVYPMATTLRVAYKVQGQNSHKPYAEVFSSIDTMPIEGQIGILYASFEVANPDKTTEVTRQKFLDWYLDNSNVNEIMDQLKQVIGGILGKDISDDAEESTSGDKQGN